MFDKIKNLFSNISEQCSITIVRTEQKGRRHVYPFLSYKVISQFTNSGYSDIITYKEVLIDGSLQIVKDTTEFTRYNISITFCAGDYSDLFSPVETVRKYLKSQEMLTYCKQQEISIVQSDILIQDRTVYLDPVYEYRMGFDIAVIGVKVISENIDGIVGFDITISNA